MKKQDDSSFLKMNKADMRKTLSKEQQLQLLLQKYNLFHKTTEG
jgi:hypothetical protein